MKSNDLPEGAKRLGCMNCRVGDRERHPELGKIYCAVCPVTLRRKDGQPWRIVTNQR